MQEPVTPNPIQQTAIALTAMNYAAHNGGREYTHNVDGVNQYPDLKEFTPQNMTAFAIVVNLELRKHS